MARFVSMKLISLLAVALAMVLLMASDTSAQDYGGFVQNGGPIQFPPAPPVPDMSNVVIGGSGFGFLPPRAGGFNNFGSGYNNLGSFGGYRAGSSFGGGFRAGTPVGGGQGGYRASGTSHFGGFGGYGFRGGPSVTHAGLPSFVNYVNHG